jgi:hypothetical protein
LPRSSPSASFCHSSKDLLRFAMPLSRAGWRLYCLAAGRVQYGSVRKPTSRGRAGENLYSIGEKLSFVNKRPSGQINYI